MSNTIRVAINRTLQGKAPDSWSGAEWNEFNHAFVPEELTPWEFGKLVVDDGYAFCPVMRGTHRHSTKFLCGQHLALDFDHGMTVAEAKSDPFLRENALFLYSTPSHTAEHNRFRVVFMLEEPVTDPLAYRNMLGALMFKYAGGADPACSDAGTRLFFGSPDAIERAWFGPAIDRPNILRQSVIDEHLVPPYAQFLQYREIQKREELAALKAATGPVTEARAQGKLQSLADYVSQAPDGQKYVHLRNAARTAGGYVATGLFSAEQAYQALAEAISTRKVRNMDHALKTIREQLAYGQGQPLQLVDRYATAAAREIVSAQQRYTLTEAQLQAIIRGNMLDLTLQQLTPLSPLLMDIFQLTPDVAERWQIMAKDDSTIAIPLYAGPDDELVINMELRDLNDTTGFETEMPGLVFGEGDGRPIILADTLAAITLNDLAPFRDEADLVRPVVGMTSLGVPPAWAMAIADQAPTIVTWPGLEIPAEAIPLLVEARAQVATLPFALRDFMGWGMTRDDMSLYLNEARPINQ